MLKRFIVAIISAAIFSIMMTVIMYVPVTHRHPNTYYDPFGAWTLFFFILSGLSYLLGGVPSSLLIDRYVKSLTLKFVSYPIAGFIVGFLTGIIFISFLHGPRDMYSMINKTFIFEIFGTIGAFLFLLVMIVIGKMISIGTSKK